MSPKKIHDDFIKTLVDESPYSMVKIRTAEFRRGKGARGGLCVELEHSLIICDRRRSLRHTATLIGISFGPVQSTDI